MGGLEPLLAELSVRHVPEELVGAELEFAWWQSLLERAGLVMRTWRSYCLTLVGTFYGLFTPGRVGEFARVLHLDAPRSRTLPSVVWDRVADVVLLGFKQVANLQRGVPAQQSHQLAGLMRMRQTLCCIDAQLFNGPHKGLLVCSN